DQRGPAAGLGCAPPAATSVAGGSGGAPPPDARDAGGILGMGVGGGGGTAATVVCAPVPVAASSALANASTLSKRCPGCLDSARISTAATVSGNQGAIERGSGGGSVRC